MAADWQVRNVAGFTEVKQEIEMRPATCISVGKKLGSL